MSSFFVRLGSFAVLVLVFALGSVFLNRGAWPYHVPCWVDEPPSTYLMGDSHMSMGLDPALFDDAVNIARPRELMVATRAKLDMLLAAGPPPERIVLSVGPHNTSSAWERDALTRREVSDQTFAAYYGLVDWEDLGLPVDRETRYRYVIKHALTPNVHLLADAYHALSGRDGCREHEYLGGFDPRASMGLADDFLERSLVEHYGDGPVTVSPVQLGALRGLVADARAAGVDIALVVLPLHPEYRARIPADARAAFDDLVRDLERSDGVRVVDVSEMALDERSWFNHDHVSRDGTERVTLRVVEQLDPGE